MKQLALLGIAPLLFGHALAACSGMNAADKGACPVAQCVATAEDFSSPAALVAAADYSAAANSDANFVSEQSPDLAAVSSGGLLLSLKRSASGYDGATAYFTRWIHYGTITARIRSGSTAPGVVSSFQLQSEDGASIDFDWVGVSSNRAQANYYTNNQMMLSQVAAPVMTVNPTTSYIEYRIVWLPDSITWYANGFAVRTVNRRETWAEGEQAFRFPSKPARLSFSIWNAGQSINPDATQSWAGTLQPSAANTRFDMVIKSVSVECYTNGTALTNNAHSSNSLKTDTQDSSISDVPNISLVASAKSVVNNELANFGLALDNNNLESDSESSLLASSSATPTDDLSKWLAGFAAQTTSAAGRNMASAGISGALIEEDGDEPYVDVNDQDFAEMANGINKVLAGTLSQITPPDSKQRVSANPEQSAPQVPKQSVPTEPEDKANEAFEIGGFNIDGILDLMAGDESGNVNFGAIGMEVANNLANVIDMNEVGNLATTFGLMMSGIGAAAEIQRMNAADTINSEPARVPQNAALNNGIANLVGQFLANQQMNAAPRVGAHGNNQALNVGGDARGGQGSSQGIDAAQLLGMVTGGGSGGGLDIQGLASMLGGMVNSANANANANANKDKARQAPAANPVKKEAKRGIGSDESQKMTDNIAQVIGSVVSGADKAVPGTSEAISMAINNVIGANGAPNVGTLMSDFVNGENTAGVSNIAQALGIRNFFKADDKQVPEGCPSCFNCLYPGSECAHNATCNQFTGRCDCPSGWTGEDCLQPACLSPVDEGKRPAAKSGHCHQDKECRPGWGGWNCNMCLTDSACDAVIPTGEGGRCYNGSELINTVMGQCYVGNTDLSRYLPEGVTPKMTFGCDRNSSSCSAQFWISGKESFFCDLDQCNIGTWGSKSTADIQCKRMKCKCIPGRFLCGNYGLDIASVLDEVEGPVDIKCHDDGFSNCYIREFIVSKTLAAIIGDDAINMKCTVGQCVHYSQLPDYKKTVNETSKSSMLMGIVTSLFTVFAVLHLIKVLVRSGSSQDRAAPPGSRRETDTKETKESRDIGSPEKASSSSAAACKEISSMMMNTKRATVSFRDISYTIPPQGPDLVSLKGLGIDLNGGIKNGSLDSNSNPEGVQVLKDISGIVYPGQILAILGASGAGKSTLLDILSRREKCGKVTGKVQINDKDIISGVSPEEFHRMSGYVDQQDLHVATATVYESVMTSALLRLPQDMSREAKEERVREVLIELGLWSVRDSKIGKTGARGISGGEMRRVSIACELVTSPSIIYLDEPTSGLDAYNAFVVMDTLSKLARRYSRTVVCTIHQPRTDIFSMFDQLIVLAAGQMCYSGPASNIANYLESIGHPVPEGYNIADFSIDLVQQATVTSASLPDGTKHRAKDAEVASKQDESLSSGSKNISDSEWSPLLGTSSLSLADKDKAAGKRDGKEIKTRQFIVYNAHVNLMQILDSFRTSDQHRLVMKELDDVTGADWTPSSFEMVSSVGSVPHMRPVTPLQQVSVIIINIYDLLHLLYCRLKGKQVGSRLDDKLRPPLYEQFKVLSARIFRHLYRDPTLMLANYAMSVFLGLMCGILFYQLDNSIQGVQNRLGLLMFILAFYGFGSTTSLLVFSEERLLYLRERANAYYDPLAYFLAKITFDLIPLRVVPPMLLTLIVYPMAGLSSTWHQFIKFFGTLVLFNLTTASQMFFIGLLAEELVVSNFLASLMLLFSLLFGGLILNRESLPQLLQPLFGTSSFNMAYEALAVNELRYAHIEEVRFGLEIEVPTAALISSFGFDLQAFWTDIFAMLAALGISLGLSLLWLTFVIKERR
ncbi:(ABC) transporter [Coemansia sp. Benny D115]|nr:(ABC) transporter [Coemansia sp. Benny D115]